ncbi:MAG: glycogen-debranching protein [Simkania sp.]|nr:glycogen-debranching protein [Simkania sp.]
MLDRWILKIYPGKPTPLGVSPHLNGVNFSIFSPSDQASLVVFEIGHIPPLITITLDPEFHKTGTVWHVYVEGLPKDFDYSWSFGKELFSDPYAKAIASPKHWGHKTTKRENFTRARYLSPRHFDWQEVKNPRHPIETLIIYEMHVRGFTHDPTSRTKMPGTYLGLIEKIPYLIELGINAVELLPIYEFNEEAYKKINPKTGVHLRDYWGYNPLQFFCPMKRYAAHQEIDSALIEFKTMVRELHKAGIEVILDVVYNHTGEGNAEGPVLSLKGIDRAGYYLIDSQNQLKNYSGCGNTLACNREPALSLIVNSLRYFIEEFHIDGFRFDLASILTRGDNGAPLEDPPLLKVIKEDPLCKTVKLIAESWDAGGLYQVGEFPKWSLFSEWNGKYRDVVRKFLKGEDRLAGAFATAISGSQDYYHSYPMQATHSINFVTCHDGFSLYDLVSYQEKHNEENGEENRDGTSDNASWNCGAEGPTEDPKIHILRERQMRNYTLALLISLGVPMLLMGDEYGQSHLGNNNTWCQDNPINWFNWKELVKEKYRLFRFFQKTIALRKAHPELHRKEFLDPQKILWHGIVPKEPDWSDTSHLVAFSRTLCENSEIFIAFHPYFAETLITLPVAANNQPWLQLIDTSLEAPNDFLDTPKKLDNQKEYSLQPYSAIVLIAGDLLSSC